MISKEGKAIDKDIIEQGSSIETLLERAEIIYTVYPYICENFGNLLENSIQQYFASIEKYGIKGGK